MSTCMSFLWRYTFSLTSRTLGYSTIDIEDYSYMNLTPLPEGLELNSTYLAYYIF